ncbi:MAG TPA: hypothetical protein VNU66_11330, partial [Mycobacteriales bacterium]|nr:hypothetical protein [Mycobacteriales bacterium]
DAAAATMSDSTREANQGLYWSKGTGSLQASRGSTAVQIETGTVLDPLLGPLPLLTVVQGDLTAQDLLFDYAAFRDGEWSPATWYGSKWYGSKWYGSKWYGSKWYGSKWYGSTWE